MPRLPSVNDSSFATPEFTRGNSSLSPRAMGASGAIMEQIGQEIGQYVDKESERIDNLKVQDAYNKLRQKRMELTSGENGFMAKRAGDTLSQEYDQDYKTAFSMARDEISKSLTTPTQLEKFNHIAIGQDIDYQSDFNNHKARERDSYARVTTKAVIDTEKQNVVQRQGDIDAVGYSLGRVTSALREEGIRLGYDGDSLSAFIQNGREEIHDAAIRSMLSSNMIGPAANYLQMNRTEIDADKLPQYQKIIADQNTQLGAISLVDGFMSGAITTTSTQPPVAQSANQQGLESILERQRMAESRGRHTNKDGSLVLGRLLTSGERAEGVAQILPSTAKNPGYGVKPLQDNSEQEAVRFQRDYMNAMLKEFGGDINKALAAYNWGAGNVQNAVEIAKKEGKDWLSLAPKETRAYISNINSESGSGGAVHGQPVFHKSFIQMTPAEQDAQLRMAVAGRPDAVDVLKLARQEIDFRRRLDEDTARKSSAQSLISAMNDIDASGGSLGSVKNWAHLDYSQRNHLEQYAKTKLEGVTSAEGYRIFNRLMTDDSLLLRMSRDEVEMQRAYMDRNDFQKVYDKWASVNNANLKESAKAQKSASSLNYQAVNDVFSTLMKSYGIDPSPKKGKIKSSYEEALAMTGSARSFFQDSILKAQAEAGHQFTDAEVKQHAARLFLNNDEAGNRLMTIKLSDVPEKDKDRIVSAYKEKFNGMEPSPSEILNAYRIFSLPKQGNPADMSARFQTKAPEQNYADSSGFRLNATILPKKPIFGIE